MQPKVGFAFMNINWGFLRLIKQRYTKIYITLLILCIIVTLIMAHKNLNFVSVRNFINMGHQMAITAIIAFAVTNVIVVQATDLSTGANMALCAMIGALSYKAGLPAITCILLMILTGTIVGLSNGLLISYLRISPFIATFAMQQLARGLTVSISNSSSIPVKDNTMLWLGTSMIWNIPVSIFITLILCLVWLFVMNKTLYGRYVYATGGNFETARATGINAKFIQFSTLLLTGFSVGIASILYLGRVSSAQPLGGLGLEFDVLTAVFVGGALVTGGSGTPVGALLGTLLVTVIKTAMNFSGVPQFVSYVVTGCFILLAVVIYQTNIFLNLKRFINQCINDIKGATKNTTIAGMQVTAGDTKEHHVLELSNIAKSFEGFVALNNITTAVRSGEIVGLLGENGAGKSTLVNIISGVFEQTEGHIKIDGKEVKFHSPQDSKDLGIGVVHQEYSLIPELDIAQNFFYNQEPLKYGIVRRGLMKRRAKELLAQFNLDIPVDTKVNQLTVGQRQLVEVVKATLSNPWLLIMDEPTSSLSKTESERLYELINQLVARNVAIIFISHKMAEVFKICQRALVLRDGNLVNEVPSLSQITENELVNMMVGRNIENMFPYTKASKGEVALEVEHLSDGRLLRNISFNVHYGEIVVLAGLMGAGKTETVECIYGLRSMTSGTIKINGKIIKPKATEMLKYSMGFVPEDRFRTGIVPRMSIAHNVSLIWHRKHAKVGFLNIKEETKLVQDIIDKMNIRPGEPEKEVIYLSGGNQQKVVVGKSVAVSPKIFILDDPTRGIDVGAKSEIHQIIAEYKKNGAAILMISSELPEVLNVADRIYVIHNGATVKELKHGTTEEGIMYYAFGLHLHRKEELGNEK